MKQRIYCLLARAVATAMFALALTGLGTAQAATLTWNNAIASGSWTSGAIGSAVLEKRSQSTAGPTEPLLFTCQAEAITRIAVGPENYVDMPAGKGQAI